MESCLSIVVRRRRRRRSRLTLKESRFSFLFTIFFFLCFCATYISCHNPKSFSESMRLLTTEADDTFYKKLRTKTELTPAIGFGGARRLLSGPGSSPPRCTSKCNGCRPCEPVQVPVPPGMPVATEYYPEAWRCKCGIKLYMP